MHIEVQKLLVEPVGSQLDYDITDENPQFNDLELKAPLSGSLQLTRSETGIDARGQVSTVVRLECHRCLQTFDQPLTVRVSYSYAEMPGEDDLPITRGVIDLLPALREELLLGLPVHQICSPDCSGISLAKEMKG